MSISSSMDFEPLLKIKMAVLEPKNMAPFWVGRQLLKTIVDWPALTPVAE